MTQQSIRRIAVAVALVAVVALATPAQAAGWTMPGIQGSSWLEAAVQWVAGIWPSAEAASTSKPEKCTGADSSTAPMATPPPGATVDKGHGIDPNG